MSTREAAAHEVDLSPGTLLGERYEVGERLGAGGSASVFAGRDARLGRAVAVKVLHPELAADPDSRAAFEVEATAAAMLSHPGIVAVHDVGTDEVSGAGVLAWIAMERVRGHTLYDVLDANAVAPMEPADALDLAAEVLAALEHAHTHGVVHRDISPGNVMVTDDGTVKVLDFGLAVAGEQHESIDEVRGSVAYVSPEQAQGLPVDRRSDLYSVACLLFALVTGSPPYVAGTAAEVARLHVDAAVPVASERRSGVPGSVDALLAWALSKDPGARPSSAAMMRDDVVRASTELRTAEADPDRRRTQVIPRVSTTTVFDAVRRPSDDSRAASGPRPAVPVPAVRVVRAQPLVEPHSVGVAPDAGADRAERDLSRRSPWPATLVVLALATIVAVVLWWGGVPGFGGAFGDPGEQGSADVTIPDVAGQTEAVAREALADAGIRDGGVRTVPHPSVDEGRVVRTEPTPGSVVGADVPVVLIVSSGPETQPSVGVPQLDGATLTEARTMLEQAGLVLGELRREDSGRAADTVLASRPAAGADVEPGTVVDLTLASGDQVVPDVVGDPLGAARAAMEDAGFAVASDEAPADDLPDGARDAEPGTVVALQPAAGTALRLGSTVTLLVMPAPAAPPSPTTSPDDDAEPDPTTSPDPTASPTPTGPFVTSVPPTNDGTPTGDPGTSTDDPTDTDTSGGEQP